MPGIDKKARRKKFFSEREAKKTNKKQIAKPSV
jgi:hypothetical protein